MSQACLPAEHWWESAEVVRVFPEGETATRFLEWLPEYRLGRKRLLDAMLASTFRSHGVRHLITNNADDYQVFGGFEVVGYRE
jgi:predicted nucleic acid-binding protein